MYIDFVRLSCSISLYCGYLCRLCGVGIELAHKSQFYEVFQTFLSRRPPFLPAVGTRKASSVRNETASLRLRSDPISSSEERSRRAICCFDARDERDPTLDAANTVAARGHLMQSTESEVMAPESDHLSLPPPYSRSWALWTRTPRSGTPCVLFHDPGNLLSLKGDSTARNCG